MPFEKSFHVAWSHVDANGHMANTAYLDIVVDVRFLYFTERGFPPAEFARRRLGPVIRRDEVDYRRELRLLEPFRVNLMLAGLSADASRFTIVNEIHRADGELAARITSFGGWLDLGERKLVVPPAELAEALRALDRTPGFAELESSARA